ncbi:MFS transporter [Parasphingopyxis algicola]|uniref:MFS transporter n=1 Tax=Parasphingopyxis algicola TaxID=2026624 RepID=UPI0015A0CB8B|nr:MFS transporter [Parasphingopyxis algicola]QLC24346.1 MFS transporter [Parasphingopyxis algicola]
MKEPPASGQLAQERELLQSAPAAGGAPQKLSTATKLAYGFGSVAYGVKDGGLKYFLLLFYAQVIGVDARLVSLAILIALISDAFSDPIVGYWSDNFRSRWGRRHPFMYIAAVPISVSYYFIWNPPTGWSENALFWYIVVLAIIIRTFITFFETPNTALTPELTQDYDERSSLLGFRYYFGWTGGNAMTVINFAMIFPAFATLAIPNGQFNPEAYSLYGMIAAGVIFTAIMISAIGTHSRIPHLQAPPPKRELTLGRIFREIFETLSSRSFLALFIAALLAFTASGLAAGLVFYFGTYFWGFSPEQLGMITLGVFLSAIIGSTLAPIVTRKIGKKRGAIIIGLIAFLGAPMPIFLRLIGVLPGNESPFIFWFYLVANTIDVGLIICYQILAASMIADLVEQAEVKTGRRSEGLFFAASTFMRKWGEGLGIVVAGFVITGVGLATGAVQGEVPEDTLWYLGAVYVPTILALWMAMIGFISFYSLDRSGHEDNLRELARRRGAPAD